MVKSRSDHGLLWFSMPIFHNLAHFSSFWLISIVSPLKESSQIPIFSTFGNFQSFHRVTETPKCSLFVKSSFQKSFHRVTRTPILQKVRKKSFQKVVQNRTPEPTVPTPELSKMTDPKTAVTKADRHLEMLLNSVKTRFCPERFCPVVKLSKNPY